MVLFPKFVSIRNRKVAVLYYGCLAATFIGLLVRFVLSEQYLKPRLVGDYISGNMWVSGFTDYENIAKVWQQMKSRPVCQSPGDFDYWYDSSTEWHYDNYRCVPICDVNASEPQDDCIHSVAAFTRETKESLFLATSARNIEYSRFSAPANTGNLIYGGVEALRIGMEYQYSIPDLNRRWLFPFDDLNPSEPKVKADSHRNAMTLILDYTGNVDHVVLPGESLSFTLEYLFELAGASTGPLDQVPDLGQRNFKEGAKYMAGALTRIMGTEIQLELKCYNGRLQRHIPSSLEKKIPEDFEPEHTCYITANHVQGWSSLHVNEAGVRGSIQRIEQYGVRVRLIKGGVFKFLDVNNIILNAASVLVFLKLPKYFVLWFMVSCLGALSLVYKRTLFEYVALGEQIGGMVSRMLGYSVVFRQLANDDSERVITKDKLHEGIQTLFRSNSNLDANELALFSDFVFTVTNNSQFKHEHLDERGMLDRGTSFMNKKMSSLSGRRLWFRRILTRVFSDEAVSKVFRGSCFEESEGIDIQEFLNIASTSEKVNFRDLLLLFDADRKRSFTERLFTPPYIQSVTGSFRKKVDGRRQVYSTNEDMDDAACAPFEKIEACTLREDEIPQCNSVVQLESNPVQSSSMRPHPDINPP